MRIFIFIVLVFLPCAFLLCLGEVYDSTVAVKYVPVYTMTKIVRTVELSEGKDTVRVYLGDTTYIYTLVKKVHR